MLGRPKTPARLYLETVCAKFPSHGDLTIAKKAYKDAAEMFTSLDSCWCMVKLIRGHKGDKMRKECDKTLYKPLTYKTVFEFPESHADEYVPYIISQSRTLIISDLHFPYQNNEAINAALQYGLSKNVNCIFINGDLIDFASISRHEKDWRHRTIKQEFEAVRKFLSELRRGFPKAKIVYKYGNHDERWEKYLYVKAPEIFDCEDFMLEVILRLGELKIEVVKDKLPVNIGKLTLLHGHELPGGGGVNPSRGAFLKTLTSCAVGHFHKTSEHTEAQFLGDIISVKSIGCLCGLHPAFMPVNKWNLGFGYCELDIKTGDYMLENLKIIKNKVYK